MTKVERHWQGGIAGDVDVSAGEIRGVALSSLMLSKASTFNGSRAGLHVCVELSHGATAGCA